LEPGPPAYDWNIEVGFEAERRNEPQRLPPNHSAGTTRWKEKTPPAMPRRTKRLEVWLTRHAARALLGTARALSDRAALSLGAAVGSAAYLLLPRYRRTARATLSRAFGNTWSPEEIEATARQNFRHLGQTLVEFVKMSEWDGVEIDRRVKLRGTDHLDAALTAGRGVVCVTAHYGNWELLAARMVRAGYPLSVLARTSDDPAIEAIIASIRRRHGYHVIDRERRSVMRPSLECLRQNKILGILMDQNTKANEIFVEFFGHPASTATGPAILARRTGALLVPVFDRRQADGRHVAEFLPALEWDTTSDAERDIREMTICLTRLIEAQVRADPTQWFWIADRWKRQPAEQGSDPLQQPVKAGGRMAPGSVARLEPTVEGGFRRHDDASRQPNP
jgi:KDO2-lipid IV(A) lauroyltransferase